MKLVIPIALRQYQHNDEMREGDDLCIAQTVSNPIISSTGPGPREAIEAMRLVLADYLGRVHPRFLRGTYDSARPWVLRRKFPLFRASMFDWYSGYTPQLKDFDVWVALDILITERPGGFFQVTLPIFGYATLIKPEPEEIHIFRSPEESRETTQFEAIDPEEQVWPPNADPFVARDAIDKILLELSAELGSDSRHLHRPTPTEMSIVDVEVEFEPLDLTRIPPDELWADVFDDDLIEARESDAVPTPTLDQIAQNWSQLPLSKSYERELTIQEITKLLLSKEPVPTIIIGPPRIGKTAVVRHLAWHLEGQENGKQMWFCDGPRLVATEPMSAGWQQQVREVVSELEATGDIIFLGRLSEALDAGKYFGSDYNLAQFLKPTLVDRRIRVIAEATIEEWTEIERRDVGFARCFTVVRLEELSAVQSHSVIVQASQRLAGQLGLKIEPEAIDRARHLQARFATEGSPVGRTVDFLKRTMKHAANRYKSQLGVDDIIESFCADTGLPSLLIDDRRQLQIDDVEAKLKVRVKGQDDAVRRVADVVGITKAGLASEDRPLSSFLFVGPTGVGKTELARALADFLFGSHERMVRLDMSEYSHADAYARLIGEGREDGDLTGPVRRQPFCVVLLDEIEKAHISVFDLLLQVLGEARLTDVKGRTTRFQNCMIIMTSNLGVESLRPAIGFEQNESAENYAKHFRKEAERFFRPEFLARIDQFIAFRALTQEVVREIAHRELEELRHRDGLRAQDIELTFSEDLPAWLAQRGFHTKYGARPLKRVLEREVVWKLAHGLAANPPEPGMSRAITITTEKSQLKVVTEMVTGDSTVASARQQLLLQIDEIAEIRRKVQRHMLSHIYCDREWEVDHFDISSQSPNFWTDPHAPSLSQRAEAARKVVEPVQGVAIELAALEDLATEAFHARTFVISKDLTDRLAELKQRVAQISLTLLRASDEEPDRAELFMISKHPEDPWRARLIEWYVRRAKARGWTFTFWQPVPDWANMPVPENIEFDTDRTFWEQVEWPRGVVVGMEIHGYAARTLHLAENGLHRMVASDGNAVCDVVALGPYDGWPFPQSLDTPRPNAQVVRTFNFRTSEITMPATPPIKLTSDNPWGLLEEHVEALIWALIEDEWE